MVSFDMHDKCARCRDKLIAEDKCVLKKPCAVCDGFSESQHELLATPTYRILKDKKAGLLVSPKEVTVISTVDSEPSFQPPSSASAQPSAKPEDSPPSTMPSSSSAAPTMNYVTSDQLWLPLINGRSSLPGWRLFYHGVTFSLLQSQLSSLLTVKL